MYRIGLRFLNAASCQQADRLFSYIFFSNASSRINDRMREMTAYLFAELVEAAAALFLNRSRLGSLRAQLEAEEDVTTLSFSIFIFAPLSVSQHGNSTEK